MPSFVASAPTVLVLSMMLSKRGAFIFCQTFTRSRSAPCIRPSSISTTSRRAPSVEYTVPISRPMMPPPRISMRLGSSASCSAPVESTTRGSLGMKGRLTGLRAGRDDGVAELDGLLLAGCVPARAGGLLHFQVVRVQEGADAAQHRRPCASWPWPCRPPVSLPTTLFLWPQQLGAVDRAACRSSRPGRRSA